MASINLSCVVLLSVNYNVVHTEYISDNLIYVRIILIVLDVDHDNCIFNHLLLACTHHKLVSVDSCEVVE